MMRILTLFAAPLVLSACIPAARPPAPVSDTTATDAQGVPVDCPLTVSFGSYAMGIDRPAYDAVMRTIGNVPATRHPWGREGEVTLCVRPGGATQTEALFDAIKDVLPSDPRGPVTVRTRTGLRFEAGNGG